MAEPRFPSKKKFEQVCDRLNKGEELTISMIGEVFGQAFWIMIVYLLLDANDAARAIQNAIARLKQGEVVLTGEEIQ